MQKFTQKYTFVQTIKPLPDGYEYGMENWPLHVTLADVFAIQRNPHDLLDELQKALYGQTSIQSKVIGEEWFGEDKSVHVMLLEKPAKLQELHEHIVDLLEKFDVRFNHPEYTREGLVVHSTIQKDEQLHLDDTVAFDSITLIDKFPQENPYRRKVLGAVHFAKP